jgi:hypothetical protein
MRAGYFVKLPNDALERVVLCMDRDRNVSTSATVTARGGVGSGSGAGAVAASAGTGGSTISTGTGGMLSHSNDFLQREKRCIFYLLGLITAESSLSQNTNGIVLFWILRHNNALINATSANIHLSSIVALLKDTFPARFAPVNICCTPSYFLDTQRSVPISAALSVSGVEESIFDTRVIMIRRVFAR